MQEKKNIRLLISLALLSAATVAAVWLVNSGNQVDVDKDIFKIANLKEVDQVKLESPGKSVDIKFNGAKWRVNEQFEADRNLIDVLFATLQQAESKRPVTSSMRDSIGNALEKQGVKVSLWTKGSKVKTFYAGGNRQKTQAYFKEEGSGTPYQMVIPGYRVYTSGIFELDPNGWRDKRIFNFNWRNFKSLGATFPDTPEQNFVASFMDRYFGIEGIETDTTKLNNYLDAVSLLNADQFIDRGYSKAFDSLFSQKPSLIIDVMDVADRHYRLALYIPANKSTTIPGILGEDQYVVLSRQKAQEIFRKRDYFRKRL